MSVLVDLLYLFHLLLIVVWLGFDFIVFALSVSLLKQELAPAIRLERAHLAEIIDRWVLIAFVLTIPVGLTLAYYTGWPLAMLGAIPWLRYKLTIFAIVVLLAIRLLTGASATTGILRQMVAGEANQSELETQLRANVIRLAPYAIAIHLCLIAMIFIALTRGNWQ
jgi:hypothetical protein